MARKLQSDKWLFLATLALICVSVVMVYSASALVALERFQQPYLFVTKQLMLAAARRGPDVDRHAHRLPHVPERHS